jgi:hypothetical protein
MLTRVTLQIASDDTGNYVSKRTSVTNFIQTVKLLSIPQRHIGGVVVELHSFLASALHGGEWLTSRPGRLITGKNPGTHSIGG